MAAGNKGAAGEDNDRGSPIDDAIRYEDTLASVGLVKGGVAARH